jgi:DNA polymerase III gamma/tau subunit
MTEQEGFQALYNKYRPQQFAEVVGQKHIVRILQNSLAHNRVSHAYLFSGERGTGKTTVASSRNPATGARTACRWARRASWI